jgi:hypothetical protein
VFSCSNFNLCRSPRSDKMRYSSSRFSALPTKTSKRFVKHSTSVVRFSQPPLSPQSASSRAVKNSLCCTRKVKFSSLGSSPVRNCSAYSGKLKNIFSHMCSLKVTRCLLRLRIFTTSSLKCGCSSYRDVGANSKRVMRKEAGWAKRGKLQGERCPIFARL